MIPKLSTLVISDIISNGLKEVDRDYILNKMSRADLNMIDVYITEHLNQRNQQVICDFKNEIKEKNWPIKAVSVELTPNYNYTDRRKSNLEIYINLGDLPHIYLIFNHDGSCVIPCLSDDITLSRWNYSQIYQVFDKKLIYKIIYESESDKKIKSETESELKLEWIEDLCDYLEKMYIQWVDPTK
jgi:hypothetical protein